MTVAPHNPVAYLLDALRSLISEVWDAQTSLVGIGAVLGVGVVSVSLALTALLSRVRKR